MPLIKGDRIAEDPWITVDDEDELPEGAPAIVSLVRWRAERDTLAGRNAPLGIRLRADQPPGEIAAELDRFQVIALEFPSFGDGRAYSYARLLRGRHGYRGELRAVGQVLRDQALFMRRCGFDAFEVAEGTGVAGWRESLGEISVFYQPAEDGRPAAHGLRRNGNVATPTPVADTVHDENLGPSSAQRSAAEPAPSGPTAGPAGPGSLRPARGLSTARSGHDGYR